MVDKREQKPAFGPVNRDAVLDAIMISSGAEKTFHAMMRVMPDAECNIQVATVTISQRWNESQVAEGEKCETLAVGWTYLDESEPDGKKFIPVIIIAHPKAKDAAHGILEVVHAMARTFVRHASTQREQPQEERTSDG